MSDPRKQLNEDHESKGVPAPSVGEFLRPRWFLGFLRAFIGSWFLSRDYRAFFAGAPAVLFAFAAAVAGWQLAQPPDEVLASSYERAAIKATELEAHAESDLMWERLMQLRPDDHRYRFVLAQSLADRGELAEAARHLEILTADDGYTPARLWLVEQSRLEDPDFPLTTEQQIRQLQAAVKADSNNTAAHRLLAQTYIEREDYRLAEQHLLQASDEHPTLGLLLYELQTKLGRQNEDQGRRHLSDAVQGFEQLALENPQNAEARIYWAQSLDYLGRSDEAEAVLTEALRTVDAPELRTAAATFMIRRAQRLITQSPLNAPIATQYVGNAVRINAADPALPTVCMALAGLGATVPDETLDPVIAQLETRLEDDPADLRNRVLMASLLTQQTKYDEAMKLLEPHQEGNTNVQAMLVRVYRLAGRDQDAELLSQSMLGPLFEKVEEDDSPGPIVQLTGALVSTRQYQRTLESIDSWAARTEVPLHELPQQLKQYYIASCIAVYREKSAAGSDDKETFPFLTKAVETHQVTTELLQLLAKLAWGESSVAGEATAMLTQILAGGQANEQIYASLGTQALTAGNAAAAVEYLRLALSRAPGNPVVQNNLALALVRQSPDNAGQALDLCNQALTTMPGQPDVLSTRAEIQAARSRWLEARVDLETALPRRPQSQLVRRLLVQVYTELNEPALAAEHQKVLEQLEQAEANDSDADSQAR